jgi:hypothetical protein
VAGSTGHISVGFFRRSHALLERLLGLIDSLEFGEDDPDRLASLFQIDHLASQMRRNSDSALVVAGYETPRRQTEPVTLTNVLRAAVSETDQYDRVILSVQPGVSISGSAAADTAHLLAELLENATTFSPQTSRVVVSGPTARGNGWLISITDGGLGMPEDQLRQLNWQLAHPPPPDGVVTRHVGLFTVAHLAARHGIKVALGLSPDGGTAVRVYFPAALTGQDTKPDRSGRGSGVRRASVGGEPGAVAVAPDPRVSAPRIAAGPEHPAEPETARPDAVPLPLAVPLPAPVSVAPAPVAPAPVAVTVPEPPGPQAGGALPVFESVESAYLQARGRDLLQPGEPSVRPPTLAAGTPASSGRTASGLPQRVPQATPVPGAAADRESGAAAPPAPAGPPSPAAPAASAQAAGSRLASFQRGSRRARAVAQTDRDANQPARGD